MTARTERRVEHTQTAGDGTPIFLRTWLAEEPKALLGVVHGLGEHGDRYAYLQQALVPCGISVHACDLRGHGRSGGARGVILAFEEYHRDIDVLWSRMAEAAAGRPIVFFGHSMGALALGTWLLAGEKPEIRGAILSAAPFEVAHPIPFWKDRLGRLLSRVAPTFTLRTAIDPSQITSLPDEVARYARDPLVHDRASARLYTEILKAKGELWRRAGELRLPLFLFHGSDDPIARAAGTEAFYRRIPSGSKKLVIYPGRRHECVNEVGRDALFEDLRRWIEELGDG